MRGPEREIEALMADRLGRPCLFAPSGRVALYIAFRAFMEPGDRLLMSPVTDDVVFFIALASGLRPVMAPVSPRDGNIDLPAVPDELWSTLGGILTTNLYGLPDRVEELRARCERFAITLIEDAAHAIETTVAGRPIGTFGDAAAFSFSKHVGAGCGGVLAFADESRRGELERLREEACTPAARGDRLRRLAAHAAEEAIVAANLVWPARWLRRKLGLVERSAHRMPLRPAALRAATSGAPDLARFHPWARVDFHQYRQPPPRLMVENALRRLRRLDRDRARRIAAVERVRALPIAAPAVRAGDPQPLFRIPLLTDERDALITRAERHIHNIGYIYDPPLDDYAGSEFTQPSPAAEIARSWAARVFPLDPLEADRFLRTVHPGAG
jgi:hypothetical protein